MRERERGREREGEREKTRVIWYVCMLINVHRFFPSSIAFLCLPRNPIESLTNLSLSESLEVRL